MSTKQARARHYERLSKSAGKSDRPGMRAGNCSEARKDGMGTGPARKNHEWW